MTLSKCQIYHIFGKIKQISITDNIEIIMKQYIDILNRILE